MSAAETGFAIGYGALERTLAGLAATTPEAIRIRFRKLRLRPFPDDIKTGTGVRVRYDLSRALALTSVFELNAMGLPQGQAVLLVERSWPEICRAALMAAADLDMIPLPRAAPETAGPVVALLPDAFATDAADDVVAARACGAEDPTVPTIRIDAARMVAALLGDDEVRNDAAASLGSMERSFGWGPPEEPIASGPASRSKVTNFLRDGPYLERARAFLAAHDEEFDGGNGSLSAIRLRWLADYLISPAPVDAWKSAIGSAPDELRLGELIPIFGQSRGLDCGQPASAVNKFAHEEVRQLALGLLEP